MFCEMKNVIEVFPATPATFWALLRSAQTAEDDGHSLGQRHCRAG